MENNIQRFYICRMEANVPEYRFANSEEYFSWMLKYYALCLDRRMPSKKDIIFLLGVLSAKQQGIVPNTRNKLFTDYFLSLGWHHPNIHTYRDRCLTDKWIRISKEGNFDFNDNIIIPLPSAEGFLVNFKIIVDNPEPAMKLDL